MQSAEYGWRPSTEVKLHKAGLANLEVYPCEDMLVLHVVAIQQCLKGLASEFSSPSWQHCPTFLPWPGRSMDSCIG